MSSESESPTYESYKVTKIYNEIVSIIKPYKIYATLREKIIQSLKINVVEFKNTVESELDLYQKLNRDESSQYFMKGFEFIFNVHMTTIKLTRKIKKLDISDVVLSQDLISQLEQLIIKSYESHVDIRCFEMLNEFSIIFNSGLDVTSGYEKKELDFIERNYETQKLILEKSKFKAYKKYSESVEESINKITHLNIIHLHKLNMQMVGRIMKPKHPFNVLDKIYLAAIYEPLIPYSKNSTEEIKKLWEMYWYEKSSYLLFLSEKYFDKIADNNTSKTLYDLYQTTIDIYNEVKRVTVSDAEDSDVEENDILLNERCELKRLLKINSNIIVKTYSAYVKQKIKYFDIKHSRYLHDVKSAKTPEEKLEVCEEWESKIKSEYKIERHNWIGEHAEELKKIRHEAMTQIYSTLLDINNDKKMIPEMIDREVKQEKIDKINDEISKLKDELSKIAI